MIAEITVSQEDFEAELFVKTVYEDNTEVREDRWTVFAKGGKITILHSEGCMSLNERGIPDEYYHSTITSIARVFKAMFPQWKEY